MSEHLQRHEVRELRDILAKVPSLVEDLVDVQTKQARLSRGSGSRRPKRLDSTLPIHLGAVEAADELHNVLTTWIRYVIETRGGEWPANALISLASWLHKNAEGLALCEGSIEALPDVRDAITRCIHVIDIPPEDVVNVDRNMVTAADRTIVTRNTIEPIARRMGENITARRVGRLENAKLLKPTRVDSDSKTKFYRLGDVLIAHRQLEQRHANQQA